MSATVEDNGVTPRRRVRSFVRREGRLTPGQSRALEHLWPDFGLDPEISLNAARVFGREAPLALEIGFGAGENLLAQAEACLQRDHLGIEVYRPGVGNLLRRLNERGLTNVRVYQADAVEVLERCVAPASLDLLQLYFPDPWPKKRHHKRRIMQPPFAGLVASRLKPGGRWLLATDWEPYAEHMLAVLDAHPELTNLAGAGAYMDTHPERVATRFERRGERLGHQVFDLAYVRR